MKRRIAALMMLAALCIAVPAAAAMQVFAGEGTVTPAQMQRICALLEEETGEAWTAQMEETDGVGLSARIMADRAPQLAIVSAPQAMAWAKEGALLALDGYAMRAEQIEDCVLAAGVYEETLYAAPLFARHAALAVNAQMMEDVGLGYLLDTRAHPVWYPSELYQALEECALRFDAGMDIWPAQSGDAMALEALLQGVSGFRLVDEDGNLAASTERVYNALLWLDSLVNGGLVGVCEDRQAALDRFLDGETALFLGWTPQDSARYAQQMRHIRLLDLPCTQGQPLRAFEVICVCAVESWDAQANAIAKRAVAALTGETGDAIFERRRIYADGAQWLMPLPSLARGPALRAAFERAVDAVIFAGAPCEAEADAFIRVARALMP